MKNLIISINSVVLLVLALGCENKDNDPNPSIDNEFSIRFSDSSTYNSNSIDFYDFSSHLIYLKAGNNYSCKTQGEFSVFVDKEEIYKGQMFPLYSSTMPIGPYVACAPTFYNDYIIPVDFNQVIDNEGEPIDDPRYDPEIIKSLKEHNLYKEGLSCEVRLVEKLSKNEVKITIELTNLDSENLLILDPDKMGLELFHYFTNGLILKDSQNNSYTHNLTIESPDSLDTWKEDWLTVIEGHKSKTFSLIYSDFVFVPMGKYTAEFCYPGLKQVEKEELFQSNGRIWLGKLESSKVIDIE